MQRGSLMKKLLKLCGIIVATSILLVIAAGMAFYQLVRDGEFRSFFITQLEQHTEFKVHLGEADLEIGWISGIAFRDLTLSEPDAAQPAVTAEQISARVALLPLLQRKLVLYEVRLYRPKAQLIRGKDGRMPLLERLFSLTRVQGQETEFQFDLRSLKIQQAQIDFLDRRSEGPPLTFHLRDTDAEVKRVRGGRLRGLIKELLASNDEEPAGHALEFALAGILETDHGKSNISAEGKLISLGAALEFHGAWWSADLRLVDLPADLVLEYAGRLIPFRSMSGQLVQRLRIVGRPLEQLRISGDLEFRKLGIVAPELFPAPLALGDGRATFAIDWSPQQITFSQVNFRSTEAEFSLQGEVRSLDGEDPRVQLSLAMPPLAISTFRKYIPAGFGASSALANLIIQEGKLHLRRMALDATLSEIRGGSETGLLQKISLEAQVRDVIVKLDAEGALPLREVRGDLTLDKGTIGFADFRVNYGNTQLNSIEGSYAIGDRKLEAHGRGDLDLAEVREQMKIGIIPAEAVRLVSTVQEFGGRARADLSVRWGKDAPLQFQGRLSLDNARLRKDELSLMELTGDLWFSTKEIKGEKITATISGSPVQIDVRLADYASADGSFAITAASTGIKAGILARLLLSSGSIQDPGVVRGAVRYEGSLSHQEKRKLTGNLDLVNVHLTTPPLLQPIRELSGKIIIDEKGVDFHNLKGLLVGFPSTASGRWRFAGTPQLLFDFAAPDLNLTYLISQVDPESSELYANLRAQGRIALAKATIKAFELTDLKAAVAVDRRVWRLTDVTARAAGGTVQGMATIADPPDTLEISAQSRIQGVSVQSFLNWFDAQTTEMTGKVSLAGSLETTGDDDAERKKNMTGALSLRIEDGTINRMRILVQILNLLDLSRWFTLQLPDLSKEGIRFRSITGDFKVSQGVYITENLVVDSDDLRMTGSGRIDVSKDELDFVVAVRPFAAIDSAISYIPLLGRGIAAIKNSFLVASFNIRGPIADPMITPAPLGTLSEWFWGVLGIPKNIIGLGGGEKEEPIKAPSR